MKREKAIRILLSGCKHTGYATRRRLKKRFGSFEAALENLGEATYLSENALRELNKIRSVSTERVEEMLDKSKAQVAFCEDENFPKLLGSIIDPPDLLLYRGVLFLGEEKAVSIVGARRETRYGRGHAFQIAKGLAENGITVVSGLAYGIDAAAHQGALKGGGRTVAFLGSGLNKMYPKDNQPLAKEIMETGGVIFSEYGLSAAPKPYHFPFRNRLVSGYSQATLLIEAREKSGTLITVGHALSQGREVFCLPGPIDSATSGVPHRLIREGAHLCTSYQDILDDMNWTVSINEKKEKTILCTFNENQEKIVQVLSKDEQDFNALLEITGLETGELNSELSILEIFGIIQKLPGQIFRLMGSI